MFIFRIGASGRLITLPLQFPDIGEPGGAAGTPPATGTSTEQGTQTTQAGQNTQVSGTPAAGQANTPPATGGQPVNQGQTPEQQLQAAVLGMNSAQREAAELRKVLNGSTPEQVTEALQFLQQATQNPQALITNYIRQNPQALSELTKQIGPLQAAQMFNQAFNGQQPLADPYENVTTYEDFANVLLKQVGGLIDKKINPVVQPIQQTLQSQKETAIKGMANNQIDEFIKAYPKSGLTQQAVWDVVKAKGMPLQVLEANPSMIDWAIMEAMGGRAKFEEQITANAAQKFTTKVIENNTGTATVTPSGGVSVAQAKQPIMNPQERRLAALKAIDTMKATMGG